MGAGDGPVVGLGLVGVLECAGAGVSEGGMGSLVREAVGLAVRVGEEVGECGVRGDGEDVALGCAVSVLLGVAPWVGGKGVADLKGPGRAVSVAETASAMSVTAPPLGSAVPDRAEQAATSNSKMHRRRRRVRKGLRFTL
jgi:hypothetical protein